MTNKTNTNTPETEQKDYNIVRYWSNGFKYKFIGESYGSSNFYNSSNSRFKVSRIKDNGINSIFNRITDFPSVRIDISDIVDNSHSILKGESLPPLLSSFGVPISLCINNEANLGLLYNIDREESLIEEAESEELEGLECETCGKMLNENDMDLDNGNWICQNCEEDY